VAQASVAFSAATGRGTRNGVVLPLASLGTFVALVAFTLPFADLTTIAAALRTGPAVDAWILSSMSVGLAAALLIAGTLADLLGRRRMFVLGCVILAATSWVGLLPHWSIFVAARIGQGLGGAAIIAAGLGLIAAARPEPARRTAATAVWGAALGGGIAVGPLLAVAAHQLGAWWAAYLATGLLAGATALLARVAAPETRPASTPGERRRPDVLGGLVFAVATVILLTGLVQLRLAAGSPWPVLTIGLGLATFAGFVVLELRLRRPVLDPRLFRGPRFTAQVVAGFTTGIGIVGLCSIAVTYLIKGLGFTVLGAAATLLIWSGTSMVTALLARPLSRRISGGTQLTLGLVGVAAGQALMIPADDFAGIAPGLLLAGVASGVLNAGLGREAVASVPAGQGGFGSGVNNTARYLGSAIGVTITGILLLQGQPGTGPAEGRLAAGWSAAALTTTVLSVAGGVVVALLSRASARRDGPAARRAVS